MSGVCNIKEQVDIKTVDQLFRLALDKEKFGKLAAGL